MTDKENWGDKALEKISQTAFSEQRKARRWGIFFKLATLIYLSILLFFFISDNDKKIATTGYFTALISINGEIGSESEANANDFKRNLNDAYNNPGTKGIILSINSPGGSPVQAGIMNDEIRRLKSQYPQIPIYAVVEDICASGAYYVAVATDSIFVDKASIVGSIGVLMDGFGFEETINKLGIERRLMTAGNNKALLDPFSPINPKHKAHVQDLLDQIHQQFINVVMDGRGEKLKKGKEEIFSGLFWNGEKSIKLGLTDYLGDLDYVAREIIGHEQIEDFTTYETFADRFAKQLGVSIGSEIRGKFFNNFVLK
ncbi:MAG: S49 family peptidase [Methylophilaceae bacterium]|nr:S49 family peptidase [Methylophilaceae bacterium]